MSISDRETALLEQIFSRHAGMVFRRAKRLLGNESDAEEALQEVFIRAMESGQRFEEHAEWASWLFRICTNYCLNRLRDTKRRRELWVEQVSSTHTAVSKPSTSVDMIQMRALLAEANEQQAKAALLVFVDGMTTARRPPSSVSRRARWDTCSLVS